MLPGTSERNQRHTFLHVSFSDSFGLASVRPPHRVCRVRLTYIIFKIVDMSVGVRVDKRVEEVGLDIYEHG